MKNELMDRFAGISCAWTDAAGQTATECRGFADRESGTLVNENTIFPACSISKFVTAICVMKLYGQGLIDMDAPVNAYLHQWKLRNPEGCESDASVRTLLCHTAGVADGQEAFYGLRRSDPPVSLMDILEGRTAYNNRPVRAEKPQGAAFEYSDAGYCVLQLLVQEVTGKPFEDAARDMVFDALGLKSTFFASPGNIARFEKWKTMATGYDSDGQPIRGRFPEVPDLAASGLWSTPAELLAIAQAFVAALKGRGDFLRQASAQMMAMPVEKFPWTGLGLFLQGQDVLLSQGWGENGQCMLKMNCRTEEISVVMTNQNPDMSQAESGVEWLVDRHLTA